ncbi:MAG: hypothetical protein ABL993_07125 [Vicinamibacterales bacterium]
MDIVEQEDMLRNIDIRVSRIEQILPTLATKEDLKAYATKEDLKVYATHDELRRGLDEVYEKMAHRFDVVAERIEGHVRMVAEGHAGLTQRLEEVRAKAERDNARLDRRVTRLEGQR